MKIKICVQTFFNCHFFNVMQLMEDVFRLTNQLCVSCTDRYCFHLLFVKMIIWLHIVLI